MTSPSPLLDDTASDADLVAAVRGGERGRFAVLVRRHNQRLYRAARAILRDDAEAEDAVQTAWVSAFRSLDGFRGDAAFSTWVTRIVVHEASARLRARGRRTMIDVDEVALASRSDPGGDALARELGRLLERELDELPDGLRSVVVLRDVLELDTAETATALGISDEAVRVRLHRARNALASSLASLLERGSPQVWRFDGMRCDRITDAVMAAIA